MTMDNETPPPVALGSTDGLGPLLDSEEDPARLWAEIHLLRDQVSGPNGYATWQEAATAERMRRFKERQKWTTWLVKHGMLHYHDHCCRPDGSNGPAWVLRAPYMVNGDSCEAWSAGSAADALREFLNGCADDGMPLDGSNPNPPECDPRA